MIHIQTEYIQEIPILNVSTTIQGKEVLPTVIFLHGYTSSKEQNLSYAYLLAKQGYRVLLPDAPLHGERSIEISSEEQQWKFWDIVVQSIEEIQVIISYYLKVNQTDPNRIGVMGTSMGSITMFGALTQYDWIKAAVSLMGTPSYEQFANWMIQAIQKTGRSIPISTSSLQMKVESLRRFDLSLNPSGLAERPLLIWHGEADQVIPYHLTRGFYESIKENNLFENGQVQMITDPIAGHKVTRAACHQTVDWMLQNL